MKQLFYFLLLLVIFTSCNSSKAVSNSTSKKKMDKTSFLAEQIINSASENIGVRYKMAGTTKSGFDCSGLVYSTFGLYDIKLPRTSYEQSKIGIELGKDTGKAQKGDLIFFRTSSKSKINHVGIVTEVMDDEILFVHSSTSKGVIVSSTKEPYYQKAFVQLNRIIQ
ncbi:C40 family peptidase [Flavobacterium acetivorans]|uniref:C40 family peptidase n=1 Tax=Flavobacterium acetivorans TaxID=2893883 RepID=UPI001E42266C|nr:C40 family peptidase [Flavobacterium sp. F-29]UFH35968.1 C40 family peptidase [Flavobacterium sp. F-29]